MTAVIEASSAGVKDMADGSLRITFEFDPRHAAEAFALFGPRGRAVAVAALKDGAGAITPKSTELEKPKGGQWAKQAGMWCADDDFCDFIRPIYDRHLGGNGNGTGDLEIGVDVKNDNEFCVHALKVLCEINSRVELDNDRAALARYNEKIRYPFMKWMQARGISK